MDDWNGSSICIGSASKSAISNEYQGVQTDALVVVESAAETMRNIDQQTQTEKETAPMGQQDSITLRPLSKGVVDMVLNSMEQNSEMAHIFNKLNALHSTNRVALSMLSQFRLQQVKQDESVLGIESGSRSRIAVLLGEWYHESWCLHNGRVLICRRTETSSITLPGCPSVLRFGSQGLIAIGTVTGQILITTDHEILSATEAHQLAVTSLEWLSPNSLISASLDGRIISHVVKSAALEPQHSTLVGVSDLPRKIRKSNSTSRPTGIVAICVVNDKLFIGGETGAIWSTAHPELTLTLVGLCEDGIETLVYHSPHLLVVSPSAKAVILTQEGTLVRSLEYGVRAAKRSRSSGDGGVLVCGDGEQLHCIYNDANDNRDAMHFRLPHAAFALDDMSQLICIDKTLTISVYKLLSE